MKNNPNPRKLDLEEILNKKKILERDIQKLLENFLFDTGLPIAGAITTGEHTCTDNGKAYTKYNVKTNIVI